jgi:hypothetical protein
MKRFKAAHYVMKDHEAKMKKLVSHLLAQAELGTLFVHSAVWPEYADDGIVIGPARGKFTLPAESGTKVNLKTQTRAIQIQSPKYGAYAFVIQTGRDLQIKVWCTKDKDQYHCEAFWTKNGEDLGVQTFYDK